MRTVYWVWSWILFAAIVVQVGLAGYGAFDAAGNLDEDGATLAEDVFHDGFIPHIALGYLLVLAGLVFLVIGLIAGVGRWRLGMHGTLFGLLILQVLLAWFGFASPVVGFFHPVNALVLVLLSGWVAWSESQLRKAGPSPAPAL
jgi:uncharacterized membrane protein YhaH (DUF805 family)